MKTADIGATYRANGMGEPCEDGSYIRVVVETKGTLAEELAGLTQTAYLISLGQAELLRDGLGALLPEPRPFRVMDARITHAIEEVGGSDELFPGASIQDELS